MADSIIVQADGTMNAYMAKAREICEANHIPVCDCYARWKKLEENASDVTRLLANRVRNLNNCRYVSFRQREPSRAKQRPYDDSGGFGIVVDHCV